ncbi:NAD(P)H-dependent oxidoreductase [[Mycoplasma] testudinis]|uniref:NAD(P)H-dependent oxidoreductase n=1 Tax=[Mycoplasma] testudinis TaxID=33924 RepID=UPI00069662DA|nr:NAD(P)H-dependent oxidoreductase [[Mycoplasma] testudinis]
MKKKLIIVAHPNYEQSLHIKGFIEAVKAKAKDTDIHFLDSKGNFDVTKEQELLSKYEIITFAYPTWWYTAPWTFKKWMDEVLTPGFAYSFTGLEGFKLKGKKYAIVQSVGNVEQTYVHNQGNRYTKHELDASIIATLHMMNTAWLATNKVATNDKEFLLAEIYMYGSALSTDNNWDAAVEKYLKEIDSL